MYRDARNFVHKCDKYQRVGNISKRNEIPINIILKVELFELWRIDFMGPCPSSLNNIYILVATQTDNSKVVIYTNILKGVRK